MLATVYYGINMTWVYWVMVAIYAVTILSIIAVILSENRNPVKSLAWVTILLVVPAVGLVIYLFFGRSIKNTRMISRRKRRFLKKQSRYHKREYGDLHLSKESIQQIQLAKALSGSGYYDRNDVVVYNSGEDKFNAFESDLKSAQKFINLQYYIIEDDEIGNRIADILVERAKAGVEVRVIYDHVGSFKTKRRYFRRLEEAGVMAHPFFKVTFPSFGAKLNWRNHRKLCVIDGRIGYIGGMNIADRYIKGTKYGVWRDCHLRVTGAAIEALQFSFAVDWSFMGQSLPDEPQLVDADSLGSGNVGIQLVSSGPTSQWSNIALLFLKAIGNAKKSIWIQTPYFLPTESLLKALQSAALSKVDVRIMIPRNSDSILLRYASFSYIQECLNAGIKIYLYDAGMLHSKTIVIDEEFATIGSTNFDFRSFEHNFEANMFIYSREINQQMREVFNEDMKKSIRVASSRWRHRNWKEKTLESILRPLSPIL
ncbi:MAG: cardiolipin synthase [Muribaculaceae bacterium]|nr:cardiolipin synthase [Muribaculaceae bacterium]